MILKHNEMRHRDSLIMFEDDQGSHPNLWAISLFLFLVVAMLFNLYNFHKFQMYQEEMAGRIEDVQF